MIVDKSLDWYHSNATLPASMQTRQPTPQQDGNKQQDPSMLRNTTLCKLTTIAIMIQMKTARTPRSRGKSSKQSRLLCSNPNTHPLWRPEECINHHTSAAPHHTRSKRRKKQQLRILLWTRLKSTWMTIRGCCSMTRWMPRRGNTVRAPSARSS